MVKSDIKKVLQKEQKKNQKQITTAYFFLAISVVCYAVFFLYQQEMMLIGTAFLFDAAAIAYLLKAIKNVHPYWEMQQALKFKEEPTQENLDRFCAAMEIAKEENYPPFTERAREIFNEMLLCCQGNTSFSPEQIEEAAKLIKHAKYK